MSFSSFKVSLIVNRFAGFGASVRIQSSSCSPSLANSWNRVASDDGSFSSAARYRGRDRVATGLWEACLKEELDPRERV
jgi:hypothetical protein